VGFVILELPWFFFLRTRKLAQNLLDSHSSVLPSNSYITRPLASPQCLELRTPKHRALTGCRRPTLVPCHRLPPSRRVLVVSVVGRRGQQHRRIHRRRAGGVGRSHPCYLLKDTEISNLEEGRALNSWLIGL